MRVGRAVVLSIVDNTVERMHFDSEQERLHEVRAAKLTRYCTDDIEGVG